ncbi:TIGR04211 family SH3 domain-containing protein [Spiribacter sp. 218]|uniref:TIGR04211 family SH3 domain-containing protein n=1 Tax=Spiribacter pallidus TaxID=1987936 RepID=UPI00349FA6DD
MLLMLLVVGLFAATAVQAQTRAYVTDELEITLRSGQGNDYRIIRLLRSGAEVSVLNRGETWTRVQVGEDEGFVRSIYLDDQPVAAARLAETEAGLERVRADNRRLEAELARARERLEALSQQNETLETDNQRMAQRLEEAGEGLALADENQRLRKQVIDLERQVQDLQRGAERMAERERQDWFVAGAAVVVFGMLLGIAVTRVRWRRRSSWGDL